MSDVRVLSIQKKPKWRKRSVASPTGHRVLLAEDTPSVRILHAALLRHAGHEVVTVEDGAEAVIEAAMQRFDVILMDINMPVLDGYTATMQIRCGGGPNAATPIVALTSEAVDEAACREFGLDEVLAKPCSVIDLRQAILRHTLAHGFRQSSMHHPIRPNAWRGAYSAYLN